MQQHLFFVPAVPKVAWRWGDDGGRFEELERLEELPDFGHRSEHNIAYQAELNDRFRILPEKYRTESTTPELAVGEVFDFKDEARWRSPSGSWHSMLVTQPPITDLYAEYIFGGFPRGRSPRRKCEQITFTNPKGVTIGELLDFGFKFEAEEEKVNWDRCWFQTFCRLCMTEEEVKSKEAADRSEDMA